MYRPSDLIEAIKFSWRVRDYKHRKVNPWVIYRWLQQFPKSGRREVLQLLPHIQYYSEENTRRILCNLNEHLLKGLSEQEFSPEQIIYVTLADTANSSHEMLGILKNSSFLEKRGVKWIDGKDILGLVDVTNKLGEGAIIYVDDFAASGTQFATSRNFIAQYVPLIGTFNKFAEFFLLPCICEEARSKIDGIGIDIVCKKVHSPIERPLHPASHLISPDCRERMVACCAMANANHPLGFGDLATMVVFYRNVPNTTPLIFRGNVGQDKIKGILPARNDLLR